MTYKIAADSSANLLALEGAEFTSVPLKIVTSEREYVDDDTLDVDGMVADLAAYKGRSGSSCPNIQDWMDAFDGADGVFCVTITSSLSGSCNSAMQARKEYLNVHPDKKIYIVDTLSAGPEQQLIVEKLRDLIGRSLPFDDIVNAIESYRQHTHLLFSLESMKNLVENGRVSRVVAALAGKLGIRIVGKASDDGTLALLHKYRGGKKAIQAVFGCMAEHGYAGGRVRIAQCQNPAAADTLRNMLLHTWPCADVQIVPTRGLCAFYAESGGLMIGYEDNDLCGTL